MCRKGSHGRVSIDRLNWEAINISTDTQLTLQLILSWHSIDTQLRDQSFIRGRWAGANGVEATPFCAPENKGLHKILQPFLRGHVVLCIPISVAQKRNNTEGINNKSNMIYYQNDRITKKGRGAVWPSGQHVGFTIHCSWLWVPPWPLLGFVSQ